MPDAPFSVSMTFRRVVVVSVVALSLAAGACSDPFKPTASSANFLDTLTVFALTGTAQVLPTAFDVPDRRVVRATGDFTYDVVFDLDAQNQVLMYPVKLIGGPFAATR